jgi:hypothetical protein
VLRDADIHPDGSYMPQTDASSFPTNAIPEPWAPPGRLGATLHPFSSLSENDPVSGGRFDIMMGRLEKIKKTRDTSRRSRQPLATIPRNIDIVAFQNGYNPAVHPTTRVTPSPQSTSIRISGEHTERAQTQLPPQVLTQPIALVPPQSPAPVQEATQPSTKTGKPRKPREPRPAE